ILVDAHLIELLVEPHRDMSAVKSVSEHEIATRRIGVTASDVECDLRGREVAQRERNAVVMGLIAPQQSQTVRAAGGGAGADRPHVATAIIAPIGDVAVLKIVAEQNCGLVAPKAGQADWAGEVSDDSIQLVLGRERNGKGLILKL